ncbi:DNA lyase [Candidatus Pacearchaeota archaeon]|nr:DNA lyase [Candidatus Pacearchaeota archaeon]
MKRELLHKLYNEKEREIKKRLESFRELSPDKYREELIFCLLTPQSNAKKCWEAVEQLRNIENPSIEAITDVLKKRTRFHNNKARYVMGGIKNWAEIKKSLDRSDKVEIRNWLAENIKGYGLKEAGHFLRNIGKSDNKIAVLDRHILRNLVDLEVILPEEANISKKQDYWKIEQKFLKFSESINIPIDELDLLFWSNETGKIFK